MQLFHFPRQLSLLALAGTILISGCKHKGSGFNLNENSSTWKNAQAEARQELNEIPAPTKNIYLAIHREPQWQNPFLSVGRDMIQLRVYLADENGSTIDRGGLTRITAARREVINVRLADLPRALSSLPPDVWPYGRVVALGKGLGSSRDRVQVRHNLEVTSSTLSNLGIVVDAWNGSGLSQ